MEMIKKEEKNKNKINLKNVFSRKLVGILAMSMICITGIFGYMQYDSSYLVESVIELDVNPSIEIEVNKKEKVVNVTPLNEDGKTILGDMDLKKADIDVAINAIIGSMLNNGFISTENNSILVSVKNDDEERRKQIQTRVSDDINKILNDNSLTGAILTQSYIENDEIKSLAQKYSISEGKANLVDKLVKSEIKDLKGNIITAEQLSKLSVNDLNLLLASKNTKLENINIMGNASESGYIGKDKAKEIALGHAKIDANTVSRMEVELDYDDGRLVYEIDFRNGNVEYDYEVDAKTGNIIESEKENDGSDGDTNYDDTDYGPNNDGVTDYGKSNYTSHQVTQTQGSNTNYGNTNYGTSNYSSNNNSNVSNKPNNSNTNYGNTNYNDSNSNNSNYGNTNYNASNNNNSDYGNTNYNASNNNNSNYGNTDYNDSNDSNSNYGSSNYGSSNYNDSGYDN